MRTGDVHHDVEGVAPNVGACPRVHDSWGLVSAKSVCCGWSQFLSDQDLGVGAFLTFEVADGRYLAVTIHRRRGIAESSPDEKPRVVNAPILPLRKSGPLMTPRPRQHGPAPPPVDEVLEKKAVPVLLQPKAELDTVSRVLFNEREPPQVEQPQVLYSHARGRPNQAQLPHFRKTLRKSHLLQQKSGRLVSSILIFLYFILIVLCPCHLCISPE